MPMLPGASFLDDSAFAPGVAISEAATETPLGALIQLMPGDVLYSVNGQPVYAPSDVFRLLLEHVNTLTAGESIQFTAVRGDGVISATSGVYFNDAFFIPRDEDAIEAGFRAVFRTITLGTGLDVLVECLARDWLSEEPTSPRCRVETTNRRLLMAQQHRTADLVGSFFGLPVPILRFPLARILPATRTSRVAATVLAESIEWGLLAANEAPAGVSRADRAIAAAPWGAGFGLLIASTVG
jgi:hypothetical protein